MAMKKSVIIDHTAIYPDPIAVAAGDVLILTGKSDQWDGHLWLWASGPDGRAGWVPDCLVVVTDGKPRAVRSYSAAELTCRQGETVTVIEVTHGWAWCRSDTGHQGWVPLRHLASLGPEETIHGTP